MSAVDHHYDKVAPLYASPEQRTRARLQPLYELTLKQAEAVKRVTDRYAADHPDVDLGSFDLDWSAWAEEMQAILPELTNARPDDLLPNVWEQLVNRGNLWVPLAVLPASLLERLKIHAEHELSQPSLGDYLYAEVADFGDTLAEKASQIADKASDIKDTIVDKATMIGRVALVFGLLAGGAYLLTRD